MTNPSNDARPFIGIQARIDHAYPTLRPAERTAADYIRDHADAIADLTVGQLATATGVSEPTVIRLSRKLGFSGYRELRHALRHPYDGNQAPFDPLRGFDVNPWDHVDEAPERALNGAKTLLDELRRSLDVPSFRKTVDVLSQASLIDIYGVENSLAPATDLFVKLTYLGLPCRLNTDAYLQQIGAAHLRHGDAAIAFSYSGSSADTVKAIRLAKSRGAHTIAITDEIGSPITNWSDICLYAGRNDHAIYGNAIFSRMAHTAIVDMLYMGVILSDYGRFASELDRSGSAVKDRAFGM